MIPFQQEVQWLYIINNEYRWLMNTSAAYYFGKNYTINYQNIANRLRFRKEYAKIYCRL